MELCVKTPQYDDNFPLRYKELLNGCGYEVKKIPGGATQNALRVAQWYLKQKNAITIVGCIGQFHYTLVSTLIPTSNMPLCYADPTLSFKH